MARRKRIGGNSLMNAALFTIVGLMLCIFRAQVLSWTLLGIGIVLIVMGVLNILRRHIIEGVFTGALGIIVLIWGGSFVDVILLVLGIALAFKGICDLIGGARRASTPTVVGSIITIVAGALLIFSRWQLIDWVFIVLGVILIIDGLLMAVGRK